MLIKRLILMSSLSVFMVGCSSFYGSQPPAPVYGNGNGTTVYNKTTPSLPKKKKSKPVKPKEISESSSDIVKTKPLEPSVSKPATIESLEPEPLTPEQEQQSLDSLAQESASTDAEAHSTLQDPSVPIKGIESLSSVPVPLAPKPLAFEPLEKFAPLSPAVSALALAANENSQSGNIESATTTIERAIRIEPRNATLYYKLALLRLKQSKPRLAEDLAKKAALLASNDTQIKKHSWLLVARARELQGDFDGGKEARAKAGMF